ncbi:LysR family transcriptional regulator [uncultured Vibrio sp.]|uniref:helix-turn-helix domain-containing protein n=1 Tax=uncultured Vibrio sp. TaxID=114054 RepID=UPI0026052DFF|nr:LysR family transcriptional regulator [uncultured Vibrio sp.]
MDLLKSIHIFQQVVEEQSFSRTADKLNLVPSAVSRQISDLKTLNQDRSQLEGRMKLTASNDAWPIRHS